MEGILDYYKDQASKLPNSRQAFMGRLVALEGRLNAFNRDTSSLDNSEAFLKLDEEFKELKVNTPKELNPRQV